MQAIDLYYLSTRLESGFAGVHRVGTGSGGPYRVVAGAIAEYRPHAVNADQQMYRDPRPLLQAH